MLCVVLSLPIFLGLDEGASRRLLVLESRFLKHLEPLSCVITYDRIMPADGLLTPFNMLKRLSPN